MITKYGVCYRLEESPYHVDSEGFRFFFSSEPHREKFAKYAPIKQEWLTDSLSRRFKFQVDAGTVALFQLYHQVETRGFYVVDNRKGIGGAIVYRSLDDVKMRAGLL